MAKQSRGPRDADAPFSLDSGETPGVRALRLEHLLFEELYRLFRMEVNDPRLAELVPSSVQMSPDLRNAKVMYALRDDPTADPLPPGQSKPVTRGATDPQTRAVQAALLRVTPFLRSRLGDALAMKRLPDLHFARDRLAEASLRAQEVITRERLAAADKAAADKAAAAADAADDAADDDDHEPAESDTQLARPPEAQRASP